MRRNRESTLKDMIRRNESRASRERRAGNDERAGYYQNLANRAATMLANLDDDEVIPRRKRG